MVVLIKSSSINFNYPDESNFPFRETSEGLTDFFRENVDFSIFPRLEGFVTPRQLPLITSWNSLNELLKAFEKHRNYVDFVCLYLPFESGLKSDKKWAEPFPERTLGLKTELPAQFCQ